jgi:hypothetical protein
MANIIHEYRIYCEDEDQNFREFGYDNEAPPTQCPNNAGHTVDVSIARTISSNDVEITNEIVISEEDPNDKTGGHFLCVGIDMSIPAGAIGDVTEQDISFPTKRGMLSAHIYVDDAWVGDVVSLHAVPNTLIGATTAIANNGDKTFSVQQSVIDNLEVGYHVQLNGEDLGECVDIDTTNLTITTDKASSGCNAGSLVKFTVVYANNLKLTAGGSTICIGESKIGASILPKNKVIRLIYKNNSVDAKEFHFHFEMLY